jgi:hypothetical protein
VTFTFEAGTSGDAMAKRAAALDDLAARSGAVGDRHSRDLQTRERNADYAATLVFENQQACSAYLTSPEHLRIVADLLTPHLQNRSAVQFDC